MAITLDASFPVTVSATGAGSQAITTATFNVSANRLIVVLVNFDADPTTNNSSTVTWNGGTPAGATGFTKQSNFSSNNTGGTGANVAEVWTAWVTSAQTGVSVTNTLAASPTSFQDRAVFVESWAGTQATIGGIGNSGGTPSATQAVSVVCTGTGSRIVGVIGYFGIGTFGVADANTTIDADPQIGTDQQAACHLTTATGAPGTFAIGITNSHADRAAAAIELLIPTVGASFSASIANIGIVTGSLFINLLDFGDYPGSNEASYTVLDSGVLSNSHIEAWIQYEAYASEKSAQDQSYGAGMVNLTCGNIIPGVGFTIYGRCLDKMQGRFKVRWFRV